MLAPYKQLVKSIPAQYDKARASGDLLAYESMAENVEDATRGFRFEMRVCPALQAKADAKKAELAASGNASKDDGTTDPAAKRQKPSDPFEGPYDTDLYVGRVEGEEPMVALLNKFSVVPFHFLLVSEQFQSQSSPLNPEHLTHAYLTLLALKAERRDSIAIYNSGEASGASQRRRHLQFVPVEGGLCPLDEWAMNAQVEREELPFAVDLPFSHSIHRLPKNLTFSSAKVEKIQETLLKAYISLLNASHTQIWSQPPESTTPGKRGEPLSYNLVLTLSHLAMVPRFKEKSDLVTPTLSLNSLAFAGMILCQSPEQVQSVLDKGVANVLGSVAFERQEEPAAKDADEVAQAALMEL